MSYKRKQLPKYCRHKGSGQAYCRIAGEMHYLGKHGSDASRREYDRIMGEFIAKCYQMVRHLRWSEGIACPQCHGTHIVKNGRDETHDDRQRYLCRGCNLSFDDLTGTVFSGSHHPLSVWMVCLYFMGLNLSNRQIAEELEMNENTIQEMTTILRKGIVAQEPTMMLEGTVECDEVYVIVGHKGHQKYVKKKGDLPGNVG
jgi:transposase-like protein